METPDITNEDGVGIAALVAILATTAHSDSLAIQACSILGVVLLGVSVVIAGAYRRGKRVQHIATLIHEDAASEDK